MQTSLFQSNEVELPEGPHTIRNLPKGWHFQETPGHGYLYPAAIHNQNVPAKLRRKKYEEDCELAIPIVFNPHLFKRETLAAAVQSMMDWFPKDFELAFKTVLQPGQSGVKDRQYFQRKDHIGHFAKTSGCGDWSFDVPKGFVLATLCKVKPEHIRYDAYQSIRGESFTALIKADLYSGSDYFTERDFIRYAKDETYYTWDDYEQKTGCKRYPITVSAEACPIK